MRTKQILSFIAVLLCTATVHCQSLSSQDSTILNQLLTTNRQFRTLQNTFRHDLTKKGSTQQRYGTLYVSKQKTKQPVDIGANISMLYDTPKGEYYIITTTNLYNGIDGHKLNFNYKYVPLMKLLGNAVVWAISGDIYSIRNNLKTDVRVSANETQYTVRITARKGQNKGISRMVMHYDKSTCLITYLEIEESTGLLHKYYMGLDSKGNRHTPQLNQTIDASVYKMK